MKMPGYMRAKNRHHQNIATDGGMILPSLLVILSILMLVGLSLATQAMLHFDTTSRNVAVSNSLFAAETGSELTLHELNQDNSFGGFAETEFVSNQHQGRVTYETDVSNGDIDDEKIVTSTGRVYIDQESSQPTVTRRVRLVVVGTTANDYGVQTGPGGLVMDNSATIANGSVYIGGYLDMDNTAHIGTTLTPATVHVGHEFCPEPPDSTFPSQCTSGEPIDMSGDSHIYGEVHAVNQTDGSQMSNPGLVDENVSEVSLPDYDRQAHKDAVSSTISGNQASCSGSQSNTWQADLKIEGDVELRGACQITVEGDIWITGNVQLHNTSRMVIADSVTETPTVMIDGADGLQLRNTATVIANNDGIGPKFISFFAEADCSPDCQNLDGVDLYDSQDNITIDIDNASLGAGAQFYARWSRVRVSNSGSIGSILGQSIQLSNTGAVSLGENLSSGDKIWTIKNYQQIFQ